MTDGRNFERMARAWLELGPNEAPDRAVLAVLQAVEATPQVRPLSQRPPRRFPTMTRFSSAAMVVVAVLILIGGGILISRSSGQSGVGGAPLAPSMPTAVPASAAPSSSPSQAVSSATPSVFRSNRYGYVVSMPAAWALSSPATTTWDGSGAPGFDAPSVDLFSAVRVVAWAVAAPTDLALADYATHTSEVAATEHGCPPKPETDESISIGGEPARLLTTHCGILVLSAVTIHNGSGVTFVFQSPFGNRDEDAADRALFLGFLARIRFQS